MVLVLVLLYISWVLYSNSKGIIHSFILNFSRKRLISTANQLILFKSPLQLNFPEKVFFLFGFQLLNICYRMYKILLSVLMCICHLYRVCWRYSEDMEAVNQPTVTYILLYVRYIYYNTEIGQCFISQNWSCIISDITSFEWNETSFRLYVF